jgi:proteasome lid subunit RPN8/RPN11
MLIIGQTEYDEIRKHGEDTYPHECCGVMLGVMENDRRIVKATVRCGNTRDDRPQDRFNIDPKDLVRIQRQGREQGHDIVGFYHSHPDCPAQWSKTDLAEAHWIGCSYVITRVDKRVAQGTNSFALEGTMEEDKHFVDEEMQVGVAPGALAR